MLKVASYTEMKKGSCQKKASSLVTGREGDSVSPGTYMPGGHPSCILSGCIGPHYKGKGKDIGGLVIGMGKESCGKDEKKFAGRFPSSALGIRSIAPPARRDDYYISTEKERGHYRREGHRAGSPFPEDAGEQRLLRTGRSVPLLRGAKQIQGEMVPSVESRR